MDIAFKDEQRHQQPKRIKTSHSSKTSEDPQFVPTLLPDTLIEILLRLPVKSLLPCKSVCKLWRSTISDLHFVKSHLSLSTSNNRYAHHRLIFYTGPRINPKSSPLYDVLYDKYCTDLELDYPLKHPLKSVSIAGCCNGLLLMVMKHGTLLIWNPSTRRSNRLPYGRFKVRLGWYVNYGFGYDESTEDYKVVGISCRGASYSKYNVKIYSLKTGSWKNIGDFPLGVPLDDFGTFSNGTLHWAARRGSFDSWKIVSLDLADETYGELLQPVYDEGEKYLRLGALGDWLCVLCDYYRDRADVWVMKDSWTKLVSVPYLPGPVLEFFSVPLCITNDGKVLLQFGEKMFVYDSKNRSFSDILNIDECLEAYTFVESLVSPYSHAGRGDNKQGG
ncbi:hypothetical protein L1887_01795 [Cichorium endivia]|nr:hypothetical protein L1887_01795 [Cichorium endivia]